MNLRARIVIATLLSAPINTAFWAFYHNSTLSGSANLPLLPLLWFGSLFRLPFETVFFVLIANPLASVLRTCSTARIVLVQCGAGAVFGLGLHTVARLLGWWEDVGALWTAASFAVSAMVWLLLALMSPPDDETFGWSEAMKASLTDLQPTAVASIEAIPWVVLGWLAPFTIIFLLFAVSMVGS